MENLLLDVVCVGPCVLSRHGPERSGKAFAWRGSLEVASLLATAELSVGLASPTDGPFVHTMLVHQASSAGILSGPWRPRGHGVDEHARSERSLFSMPESWQSNVLVISGVMADVARAGALCRLARAFRREGSVVMLDLRTDLAWEHARPSGFLRSLVVESDIVRVRFEDAISLGVAVRDLFCMVRADAVVLGCGPSAKRPTLEVYVGERRSVPLPDGRVLEAARGDALVAAVAAVCARRGALAPWEERTWLRVVARLETFAERWRT